ncbi:MAG: helix-turn-helix domain-containing protein [Acidimicrobiia bacterium]
MPERSFGRTVRYRRTKLGLSQAQLAELVGRSTATIRAWERDRNRPNDAKVISTLSAILGVNERRLFEKTDVTPPTPADAETPTVEQALAELSPPEETALEDGVEDQAVSESQPSAESESDSGTEASPEPEPESDPEPETLVVTGEDDASSDVAATESDVPQRPLVGTAQSPGYVAPPDRYVTTPVMPTLSDVSYMEDRSQRQLYRVRTLATLVALVALVVAFLWAVGEGLGALGDWWDQFFGNLRL